MRRMWMLERTMALVTAVVVAWAMVPGVPAFAAEQRHVVVTGKHLLFGGLAQTGAVTFIARTDDTAVGSQDGGGPSGSGKGKGHGALPMRWWQRALAALTGEQAAFADNKGKGKGNENGPDFVIKGDVASLNRVDGRNYTTAGVLAGSGDKAGVALDVAATELTTSDVTIQGNPAIQENVAPIDVESYVLYLAARANTTYTSNTTLVDQTIGGPNNYQIVVVKDAKLFLEGTTTGYGVLVLYDTQPGNGQCELRMEDTAKWYGVILVYSGDTPADSDKIKLRFGKQNAGGHGSGSGKGARLPDSQPSWWERAIARMSGERLAYADAGGKGKGGGGPTAGSGTQVLGAVIAEGREVSVEFPSGAVGDLFYSSEAVNNVDNMLLSTKFLWEDWRER